MESAVTCNLGISQNKLFYQKLKMKKNMKFICLLNKYWKKVVSAGHYFKRNIHRVMRNADVSHNNKI